MKLCKDCKHHEHEKTSKSYEVFGHFVSYTETSSKCTRDQTFVYEDVVNGYGSYVGEAHDCYAEREDALRLEEFRCGKEGKFWEAK